MAKQFAEIDEGLKNFITAQHIFFVASAPSGSEGHVNISPKGLDTFRVLGPRTVAYLDLTGSGVETIAHLRDNGRIVFMFCAFEGPPRIVRLHGHGEAIEPVHADFATLRALFPDLPGARAVIRVGLDRITDSCGYAVPLYRYEGERSQLLDWTERKGPDGIQRYQAEKNSQSIDRLPGLRG